MRAPALSRRLQMALDLVGHTGTLADVGCDHGKLCVCACVKGIAQRAVAVDISAPSLAKAERLAAEYEVALVLRHADGLTATAQDGVDTAVIAGMGGMETARILALATYCPPRLVLVPHKNVDVVRRYLKLAGYRIDRDLVLQDGGHWYTAIAATADADATTLGDGWQRAVDALPDSGDWYVGADNRDNPDFAAYCRQRIEKLQRLLSLGNRDPKVAAELRCLKEYAQ